MKRIDLTSPVEILACELPKKDYAACDLTLRNLSGDQVTSVEATLTLMDESGEEIARVIHRARRAGQGLHHAHPRGEHDPGQGLGSHGGQGLV